MSEFYPEPSPPNTPVYNGSFNFENNTNVNQAIDKLTKIDNSIQKQIEIMKNLLSNLKSNYDFLNQNNQNDEITVAQSELLVKYKKINTLYTNLIRNNQIPNQNI